MTMVCDEDAGSSWHVAHDLNRRTDFTVWRGGLVDHSSETFDTLFDGRLTLYQSRAGYRFSLDALLLAYFVAAKPTDRIIDLGTGNGVMPLVLASLHASVTVTGVELQPAMIERARCNIDLNGL